MNLVIFFDRFSKNTQILNFIKIREMGVELSDGRAGEKTGEAGGQKDRGRTQCQYEANSHFFAILRRRL